MIYVAVAWLGFLAWAFWGRPTAEGKRWPIATAVASGFVLMLLALSGCEAVQLGYAAVDAAWTAATAATDTTAKR